MISYPPMVKPHGFLPMRANWHAIAQYNDFVARNPDQIDHDKPCTAPLDEALWQRLCEVMQICNRAFYRHDPGRDHWDIIGSKTGGKGDCEDFALTWRKMLRDCAVPSGILHVGVATIPWLPADQNQHAGLLVNCDEGQLAMDVFSMKPRPVQELDYSWQLILQSGISWQAVEGADLSCLKVAA